MWFPVILLILLSPARPVPAQPAPRAAVPATWPYK